MAKHTIFNPVDANLNKQAANAIGEAIDVVLFHKDRLVLGLPGGRSIKGVFKELILNKNIPWNKIEVFLIDERLVGINHPDSNLGLLREQLTDVLTSVGAMPDISIHPFIYQPDQKDLGLKEYEAELKKFGGRYDIIVLGVGEDGHVGALYPQHHSINDPAKYYLTIKDSPKPPAQRMTASLHLLCQAQYAFALFLGQGKLEAYKKYLDNNLSVADCPAKLIDKTENSTVITNLNL